MKRPNIAPRPPPMTPAITVLPAQDSMLACIYVIVSGGRGGALGGVPTNLIICCSCSDMPALGFMPGMPGIPPGPPGKAMVLKCMEGGVVTMRCFEAIE